MFLPKLKWRSTNHVRTKDPARRLIFGNKLVFLLLLHHLDAVWIFYANSRVVNLSRDDKRVECNWSFWKINRIADDRWECERREKSNSIWLMLQGCRLKHQLTFWKLQCSRSRPAVTSTRVYGFNCCSAGVSFTVNFVSADYTFIC